MSAYFLLRKVNARGFEWWYKRREEIRRVREVATGWRDELTSCADGEGKVVIFGIIDKKQKR